MRLPKRISGAPSPLMVAMRAAIKAGLEIWQVQTSCHLPKELPAHGSTAAWLPMPACLDPNSTDGLLAHTPVPSSKAKEGSLLLADSCKAVRSTSCCDAESDVPSCICMLL